jgi:hypothetical protein
MGIMFGPDFESTKHIYSKFDYFIGWEFDSSSCWQYPDKDRSGLNVRDILGVHNIDIGN